MSALLQKVRHQVEIKDVRVSEHGYDALVDDTLTIREIIAGITSGIVLEEYLNYGKGPTMLLLQKDKSDNPIHVVCVFPRVENVLLS